MSESMIIIDSLNLSETVARQSGYSQSGAYVGIESDDPGEIENASPADDSYRLESEPGKNPVVIDDHFASICSRIAIVNLSSEGRF